MKTTQSLDLNSILDSDALGALAKCRQAEIRQDKNAVSLQRSSRSSRIPHFTWQRVLAFAIAVVGIVAMVAGHLLG